MSINLLPKKYAESLYKKRDNKQCLFSKIDYQMKNKKVFVVICNISSPAPILYYTITSYNWNKDMPYNQDSLKLL